MKRKSKADTVRDRQIEAAYRARCCGIQINIMDIGKVFKEGRRLLDAGADQETLATGIHTFVVQNLVKETA